MNKNLEKVNLEKLLGEEIIIKNGKKELTKTGAMILAFVTIGIAKETVNYVLNNFEEELNKIFK